MSQPFRLTSEATDIGPFEPGDLLEVKSPPGSTSFPVSYIEIVDGNGVMVWSGPVSCTRIEDDVYALTLLSNAGQPLATPPG